MKNKIMKLAAIALSVVALSGTPVVTYAAPFAAHVRYPETPEHPGGICGTDVHAVAECNGGYGGIRAGG